MDRLLTAAEAADVLSIHKQTVLRMVWDGELPWVNVGRGKTRPRIRIRQSALERWMADQERSGVAA